MPEHPPSRAHSTRPALVMCLTAILPVAAFGCADGPSAAPDSRPAITVTTGEAAVVELRDRFEAGGTVTAATTAIISSRVLAAVTAVRVRAGDRVRAGQVLVVLDDRDLAAHASQAKAAAAAAAQGLLAARSDLSAANAELTAARSWHTRVQTLHSRNSATAQELDDAGARLTTATARVEGARARIDLASASADAAQASLNNAETTRSFAMLRAPFDGLVTETMAETGNMAAPGVPLLTLDAAGPRRVEVTVDEARAGDVRQGDRVTVVFSARAGSAPAAVDGVVSEIARTIAADRRAFTVKVTLPGAGEIRTGTFARVRFAGDARRALLVPASAIRRQGQVSTVFVVRGDVARLRLVQSGVVEGTQVEVLAGLEAGEAVVVDPPAGMSDGQRVTVQRGVAAAER